MTGRLLNIRRMNRTKTKIAIAHSADANAGRQRVVHLVSCDDERAIVQTAAHGVFQADFDIWLPNVFIKGICTSMLLACWTAACVQLKQELTTHICPPVVICRNRRCLIYFLCVWEVCVGQPSWELVRACVRWKCDGLLTLCCCSAHQRQQDSLNKYQAHGCRRQNCGNQSKDLNILANGWEL
jgi:hypothetical protein